MHAALVIATLKASDWHLRTLQAARDAGLHDWAIGAGFVRNAVWDRLHGYRTMTPLADVDVLFFDPTDTTAERETIIEVELSRQLPDRPWSVRNQARMHIRNLDRPYTSTQDALLFWLETPTCVAARLDQQDTMEIIAPYGLADLVGMRSAPTVRGREKFDQYLQRMRDKNWPLTWPKVQVEGLN